LNTNDDGESRRMISKRVVVFVAAGIAVVAAVASVRWSKVVRVTLFDGGIQREHLILGKFTYTALNADPSVHSTLLASRKIAAYGLEEYTPGSMGVVTKEGGSSEYDLWQRKKGDIHGEASRLLKKMPWLSIAWHGTRSTSFYARGTHPGLGGKVSVACSRMPEGKYGPNQLHITTSVEE